MSEEKFGRLGRTLQHGYNSMVTCDSNMMMDIGYQVMNKNDAIFFEEKGKETAYVILTGEVEISWEAHTEKMKRTSLFDENPYCLHVPSGVKVSIKALNDAEMLIQKTENDRNFTAKFYYPKDVQCDIFGKGQWGGCAERTVRTIFDYENAPYSNMVNGEIINKPGRWTSYIPHFHPQPEVYTYKFDKPQGFGGCFIGDDAFKIAHNSWCAVPGGQTHPQTAAPGYVMWYSWMIRHLPGNPWVKTRTDDSEHTWLLAEDVKIWPDK
ncbi:5-deoxy-glucuronate isomerase [Pectinatus haikarae]|uniref:5-deoxy-glucuronate isomerase n=1 Tax=Pectinatus haikarae TaxID=349096 RepID=A0ABT9Y8L8_9FIRM|nr:5-deoxy-glucuronate isomerase [Pectinatus haikarae]MDQ0204152.1 5-deoxy-glucuronate isomerase [Pectinatus haikarae]